MPDIQIYKNEINQQISNKETFQSLMQITFKGLTEQNAKRAMLEALMRGFKFQDFLEKNIYAIPFKNEYSLVTSIDYARKIGMRNGIVGVSEPIFEEKDGNIISCLVTVEKIVGEHIGKFSALVFFNEYNTGYNVWKTKPHTMIAKVAEMHALRKACPESLSQSYVEEEFEKENNVKENIYEKTLKYIEVLDNDKKIKVIENAIKSGQFDEEQILSFEKIKSDLNICKTNDMLVTANSGSGKTEAKKITSNNTSSASAANLADNKSSAV